MLKNFKRLDFWRNLILYFMVFSFVGHWLEMAVAVVGKWWLGKEFAYGIMDNWTEPYTIYGLGAVMCILVVTVLPKKITRNLPLQYAINVLVCAVVEYVSALIIIWRFGENIFWNYDERFMNLNGQICLGNSLLFGLAATVFMEVVYPFLEKCLQKINPRVINVLLGLIVAVFAYFTIIYWK
jgi:uncharacterized membrane protein